MKKIAIVYASVHHMNTKKVVDTVAPELNADAFSIKEVKNVDFTKYDVIGFGSGIFFNEMHKTIYKFIDDFKNTLPKKAFVILTSGVLSKKYETSMCDKLENKGFNVIGSFHCKGYDTAYVWKVIGGIAKGHPNEEDLKNATEFAKKMKKVII